MPFVAILVGCKKGAGECKAETEALVKLLRSADKPAFGPYSLTVELGADGIKTRGQHVELGDLAHMLTEGWLQLPKRDVREMGEGTGVVFVRVDDSVPWARVVELADTLATHHFDHPRFFVAHAPNSMPPPRAPIDDELDKLEKSDASEKATRYAKMVNKLVQHCEPLQKVFGAVSADEGVDKGELILAGMSEALPECSCDVDMPALRSALYRVYQDPHPAEPRKIALVKTGKPVALPAATPWKDAAAQLPEGQTVWLVAN